MSGSGSMILETEGVEARCEKRLGGSSGMLPRVIFELGLGNAISSILEVVLSSFKRITEVRLLFYLSPHA